MIVGEPGTGKTYLVSEALKQAREQGLEARVITVHANVADGGDLADMASGTPSLPLDVLVQQWSSHEGTVLRVEDAHQLGPAAARQLGWLMRQEQLCVIVTLRRAAAAESPWLDLWRNGSVERVNVAALSRAEVHANLEGQLGGPVAAYASWRIWEATGGYLDRLNSLVGDLLVTGDLYAVDGVWLWEGPVRPDALLMEIVDHDVRGLDDAARTVLELVALFGSVPHDLLHDVARGDAVGRLQRSGLLVSTLERAGSGDDESVAGLMHPLYAAAVRSRLSRHRRAELLDLVTSETTATAMPADLRLSWALFALDYGLPVDVLSALADIDLELINHRPKVVMGVLTHAARLVQDPATLYEVLHRRAAVQWRLGDLDAMAADHDRASQLIAHIDDQARSQRASVQSAVFGALVSIYCDDDVTEGLTRIEKAAAQLPLGTVQAAAELDIMHLGLRLRAGDPSAMAASLAILADDASPANKIFLVWPCVVMLAQRGKVSAALSLATEFEDAMVATSELMPWAALQLDISIYLALLWSGEVEQANGFTFTPQAVEQIGHTDPGVEQLAAGAFALATGVWSDAVREFHASSVRYELEDRNGFMAFALTGEALARAAAGDHAQAARLLERARVTPLRICMSIAPTLRLMWLDSALWLGAADADQQALELARWAEQHELPHIELEAWQRWLLVESRRGGGPRDGWAQALQRIEELVEVGESPRVDRLVEHAHAIVGQDKQMALVAERALATCGLWLPTLPVRLAVDLTRREREVAGMAARGMSSKVIAERLVLSVRTVDSHLGRAFGKLGVSSREELARVLQ